MSLGPDARALIEAASGGDDPSSSDEARIRAKLAARLAIAAGASAAGVTSAKASAAAAGAGSATAATTATVGAGAKIAIAIAIVSATSAGGAALYHEEAPAIVTTPAHVVASARAPAPVALPPVAPEPEPTAAAPVTTMNAPAPDAPSKRSARRISVASAPASAPALADPVVEEARLLRHAHASLASGDGRGAMAALDEHASRFPRGALAEERDAARVFALCAQGRASEARAAAAAFVSASPRSPLSVQVRRSCATNGKGTE